jgi:hypothetical protein
MPLWNRFFRVSGLVELGPSVELLLECAPNPIRFSVSKIYYKSPEPESSL